MRHVSIAFAAVFSTVASTQIAAAADLPAKAPPIAPAPVAAPYNWSGFYVGGNIGGAWANVDRLYPSFTQPIGVSTSFNGAIGGLNAGAQIQWQSLVLGVEVAYSHAFDLDGSTALPNPQFVTDVSARERFNDLFTVGPRLGFAWDRWMIFATGGYARARLDGQYASTSTGVTRFPTFSGQWQSDGWFVGGGVDVVVYQGPFVDMILGAEYQHVDLKEQNTFCLNSGCSPTDETDFRNKGTADIVRARLTLKPSGFAWMSR